MRSFAFLNEYRKLFFLQAYDPKEPQANNDVPLYGLVEPNVHPQVLASSSQVMYLIA